MIEPSIKLKTKQRRAYDLQIRDAEGRSLNLTRATGREPPGFNFPAMWSTLVLAGIFWAYLNSVAHAMAETRAKARILATTPETTVSRTVEIEPSRVPQR